MKAVRLSALHTGRLYTPPPQEIFLVLISVRSCVNPRGQSAVRRIMSMKYSNDTIGNPTRDLLTCGRSASTKCASACPKVVYHHTLLALVLRSRGSLRVGRSGDRKPVGARIFDPSGPVSGPTQTTLTRQRARRVCVILSRRQGV